MILERINGITFAPFAMKGAFENEKAFKSADIMIERTGTDFVMLTPVGLQENAHSETISWEETLSDEELIKMIDYFHSKGVRVALKPTVNCKDGTWRAHIAFFDKDVVCEPKWSNWFKSYSEFQCYYANIAQKTKCEMFVAGCEMVMSEHRTEEWRQVLSDIKKVYSGPVSYNTDKYQEDNVEFWDAVDVISSSGYYPIDDWERQLDRIEAVVKKYNKPFFFAETGCMSSKGSSNVPNNWELRGTIDLEEQAAWYEVMFDAISKRDWVEGTCLWSWTYDLYNEEDAKNSFDYDLFGKPSEKVVKKYYSK